MGLLDLFRPKWKHSRLDVRLEAVKQLGEDELKTLTEVARHDPEAKVREVALKRLQDPALLLELAGSETDADVKELAEKLASSLSLKRAIDAVEDRDAVLAVERITQPKMLVDVIRKAQSSAARHRALLRLDDARALAEVAQKADDPQMRAEAVAKISEPKVLRDLAINEATKAVQLLAIERLSDPAALRSVSEKGKTKAVRQAAKDKLTALGGNVAVAPAEPKKQKQKKQLDPAAEQRLKQRKIEQELRRAAEESRKTSVAERKARLEAEHNERLRRMEEGEAEAKLPPGERLPPRVEAVEPPRPDEDPAQAQQRIARETERNERNAEKARQRAERDAEARENIPQIEFMAERLEAFLDSTDLKAAGDALKEAREKARLALPGDQGALRKRFDEARAKLGNKLNELREAEDWRRWANVPKLEALIVRAESLAKVVIGAVPLPEGDELDARKVSKELKAMQAEWKEIGPAPKVKADGLWERFKAASDIIYEGNKKGLDAADEERAANLKMKEELCARVEALVASPEAQSNPKQVSDQIKQLQEDWKKIGAVPRSENDKIWARFRAAVDPFFATRKATYQKQDEERGQVLDKQLELVKKAEALQHSTDFKGTADKLKALQDEWKGLGAGKKAESDEAWKKFRAACDHFFERRKAHFDEQDGEREANLQKKEALIATVEKLVADETDVDVDAKIRELMGEWKKIGPVAREKGDEVWARFGKALDALRNPTGPVVEQQAQAAATPHSFGSLGEKLKAVAGGSTEPKQEPKPAQKPAPVAAKPAPDAAKPAPIAATPAPTPVAATPAPAPVTATPAPASVAATPAPAPAPDAAKPAPAPIAATPAPTPVAATPAPAPVAATPAPAPVTATPAPAPVAATPAPVPVAAVPAPAPAPAAPVAAAPTPAPAPVAATPAPEPAKAAEPAAAAQDSWPAPEAWTLPDEPSKG